MSQLQIIIRSHSVEHTKKLGGMLYDGVFSRTDWTSILWNIPMSITQDLVNICDLVFDLSGVVVPKSEQYIMYKSGSTVFLLHVSDVLSIIGLCRQHNEHIYMIRRIMASCVHISIGELNLYLSYQTIDPQGESTKNVIGEHNRLNHKAI